MEESQILLLDLGEKTTPHGSEIWLRGIDDHDRNALVVDRSSGRICARFQRKALPPPQSPTFCTNLYDKARPYFEVTSDEVDTEYYVSGQVAPAGARILGIFGISQDELLFGTQISLL
jgi:hypothetical protein